MEVNQLGRGLFIQAIVKYLLGIISFSVLLFIPAGTLNYWNAWLLIGVLFIPMLIVGMVLAIKNPGLLHKRLNAKEKEAEQKSVVLFGTLMFVSGLFVAGLDYRYQWLVLPQWLVLTATVLFIFAYLLYIEVLRENVYLSRTIEVQENHKVIDTGLYGVVRNPMYTSQYCCFCLCLWCLVPSFHLLFF